MGNTTDWTDFLVSYNKAIKGFPMHNRKNFEDANIEALKKYMDQQLEEEKAAKTRIRKLQGLNAWLTV